MDPPPESHIFGSDLQKKFETQKKFGGSIFTSRGANSQSVLPVIDSNGASAPPSDDTINRFPNSSHDGGNFMDAALEHSDKAICQKSDLVAELKSAATPMMKVQSEDVNMENSLCLSLNSSISYSTKRASANRRSERIVAKRSKGPGGLINKLSSDLGANVEANGQQGMDSSSEAIKLQAKSVVSAGLNSIIPCMDSDVANMNAMSNMGNQDSNMADPVANASGSSNPVQGNIPFTDLTDVSGNMRTNPMFLHVIPPGTESGQPEKGGDVHMTDSDNLNGDKKSNDNQQANAWKTKGITLADKSRGNYDSKIVLKYKALVVLSDGRIAVRLSKEVIMEGSKKNVMLLVGHFVGAKLPFYTINNNLNRMWRKYGLVNVAPNYEGFYLFKFNNEEGMKFVIENGPWLVNGIPLYVSKWEAGMYLGKPELKTLPLWVNLYGVPLEVWNAEGLGELASGIGKPLALDRATEERCIAQAGRAGFARILVEVSADKPIVEEITALVPMLNGGSEKEVSIRATYNWKPARCKHCNIFGHVFNTCSVRPLTEEEVAAKMKLEEQKNVKKDLDDGFQEVGRRNACAKSGQKGKRAAD